MVRARNAVALNRATVASPAQVRAILAQVMRARPELAAFFGCLYCAALRVAMSPGALEPGTAAAAPGIASGRVFQPGEPVVLHVRPAGVGSVSPVSRGFGG